MHLNLDNLSLSKPGWARIRKFFVQQARPLELAQFLYHFENQSPLNIIDALKSFQNADGGFGHGIEPDFHLPLSTPMATSVGLQTLNELPDIPEKRGMIQKALEYLKGSFRIKRKGWYAVREEVNEFPHAPWWDWSSESQSTVIDTSWGNPSAELIGYLWKYRELIDDWIIRPLLEHTVHYLSRKSEFKSEHEIYCYLRLYRLAPDEIKTDLYPKLNEAVSTLVVEDPKDPQFTISDNALEDNLAYVLKLLENKGKIEPNWEWGTYPAFWEHAHIYWTGILTLRNLKILQNFGIL